MKTWLALAVASSLIAVAGVSAADPPRAADLEAELVCPTCKTTLDQSDSPVAKRMKVFIRSRIAAGDTEDQIKDALVAQFSTDVLAKPPVGGFGLLAWLLPVVALAGGAIAVGLLVRSWSRRRASPAAQPLDPALEERVDEALARFED
jgi:cytochrome c-type biogenesis protein CcmH